MNRGKLNQSRRGGTRKGAGRPPHDPPLKLHGFRLTDAQMKLLRMWGKGDASAGLRWLIEASKGLIVRAEDKQ